MDELIIYERQPKDMDIQEFMIEYLIGNPNSLSRVNTKDRERFVLSTYDEVLRNTSSTPSVSFIVSKIKVMNYELMVEYFLESYNYDSDKVAHKTYGDKFGFVMELVRSAQIFYSDFFDGVKDFVTEVLTASNLAFRDDLRLWSEDLIVNGAQEILCAEFTIHEDRVEQMFFAGVLNA